MMRGECEGHLGDTVPKWGAVVNGAPGALQSRDPGLPEGRRSPTSIWINSRQTLAVQGFGERSDVFCEDTVSQKIRRFEAVKKAFLTASKRKAAGQPSVFIV